MHHVLFWVLAGLIVSRIFFRLRMRRIYGHAWGGCHGRHRFARLGGPIDLGAPDRDFGHRHFGFGRWGRRMRRRWEAQQQEVRRPRPVIEVVDTLELNQRQREIFDEVVTKTKTVAPTASVAEALSIVGREPFDRAALDFLVASGELVDDFEHLHHSLTAEQRAKLREVVSA